MESKAMEQAMKDSGLPTASTPELNPNFQFNTPFIKAIAAQEQEMLGLKGGSGCKRATVAHVVLKGGKKKYVVRTDGGKKCIQKDCKIVYLSEIRGKYKYV